MSKPLRRPMFRMGGSPNTNSGIVSGFEQPRRNFDGGGSGLEPTPAGFDGSAEEDAILAETLGTGTGTGTDSVSDVDSLISSINLQGATDLQESKKQRENVLNSMKAQKQSGLSTGDWLRIAAAGGEILGAEGRGSGLKGALAAAGPALSGLGKDLAASSDSREAIFQAQDTAYKQAMLSSSQSDLTSNLEFVQGAKLLALKDAFSPDQFAVEANTRRANELIDQMSQVYEDSAEYKLLEDQYHNIVMSEVTTANINAASDAINDVDFNKEVGKDFKAFKDAKAALSQKHKDEGIPEQDTDPNAPGYNRYLNADEAQLKLLARKKVMSTVIRKITSPPGKKRENDAQGGRVGRAMGGSMTTSSGPYEPGSGPNPDPGSAPVMQFEELRARLPQEVSDSVIKLIMQSEQAMVDFAQIQTPQDIQVFNQKYNTDLQTPTQVA